MNKKNTVQSSPAADPFDVSARASTNTAPARDGKAPQTVIVTLTDPVSGAVLGTFTASAKQFSTGSVGFYGSSKIANPENPTARYQTSVSAILIGSKPAA
jgi:hypothetical protein